MQVFGLRRAGLILAGVLLIGLAITAARSARRPRVVVLDGPAESDLALGPSVLDQPAPRAEPDPVAQPAIIVHVAGAVAKPGVYSLEPGARVADALSAAGGALAAAHTDCINLALPVCDGEQVYVPPRQEGSAAGSDGADSPGGGGQPQPRQSVVPAIPPNRADITRSAPDSVRAPVSSNVSCTGLININTASVEELQALPGVGPVLAQRIIDYRSANGPFVAVDDIVGVSGIGQAKLAKIAPMATVR
ncbi:MAG: ComE operon protein 1 [Firmicutes bacterium ADurb.BinA052]|jgi:competence protein ComEA|nr:MAG: ComE operon protein 1 [Firmicutes bacterium ADurb.BinA052]